MANKPDYNIVVFDDSKEGKSFSVNVGGAWRTKNGGVMLRIHPGISISGTVALLPPRESDSATNNQTKG